MLSRTRSRAKLRDGALFKEIVIAVIMLTTCNAIFRDLLGIEDKRNKKSGEICERFATLNANLDMDDMIDNMLNR
jgi:hypothetical protein